MQYKIIIFYLWFDPKRYLQKMADPDLLLSDFLVSNPIDTSFSTGEYIENEKITYCADFIIWTKCSECSMAVGLYHAGCSASVQWK